MSTETPIHQRQLADAEEHFLTPTLRQSFRRAGYWILAVTVVLTVGFFVMVLERAGGGPTGELDPEASTPQGARAVVEVLRDQGVEVVRTSSLAETRRAVAGRDDAAVVLRDISTLLTDDQYAELLDISPHLIVFTPGFLQLSVLAPGIDPAGALVTTPTVLPATCDLPFAERAPLIRADGRGYRIVDDPAAIGCFPGDETGVLGYIETETDGTRVAIIGADYVFRNDAILSSDNAAFALNVLGEKPLLVWYEPSSDDLRESDRVPTLQDLTGPWVTPLAILIVLLLVAAGIWRGRRFGPVVVERLPVEVRANETMEGRARLYARSDARAHAVESLRIGIRRRLIGRVGLARTATPAELVSTIAALLGRPIAEIERVLVTQVPMNDAELMRLSDELRALEDAVVRATGWGPTT